MPASLIKKAGRCICVSFFFGSCLHFSVSMLILIHTKKIKGLDTLYFNMLMVKYVNVTELQWGLLHLDISEMNSFLFSHFSI